jgi:hypothetical protein
MPLPMLRSMAALEVASAGLIKIDRFQKIFQVGSVQSSLVLGASLDTLFFATTTWTRIMTILYSTESLGVHPSGYGQHKSDRSVPRWCGHRPRRLYATPSHLICIISS